MDRRSIRARDGVELSYCIAGHGPPVMLLHGLANAAEMWVRNGVASRLSGAFTVLLPDRRGHGHSGRPHGADRYGHRIVDDVFDVMAAEGLHSVHMAGFSQGAEVALCAAAGAPDRVRSLYLMGTGWAGPDLDEALRIYSGILQGLQDAISAGKTWLTPEPDMAAFRAIVARIDAVIDISADQIATLNMPAAGLAGELDPERPTLERLREVLPHFALEVLPGVGHGGIWRHPSVPDRIRTFVELAEGATP